jgi:hypothetical protein
VAAMARAEGRCLVGWGAEELKKDGDRMGQSVAMRSLIGGTGKENGQNPKGTTWWRKEGLEEGPGESKR